MFGRGAGVGVDFVFLDNSQGDFVRTYHNFGTSGQQSSRVITHGQPFPIRQWYAHRATFGRLRIRSCAYASPTQHRSRGLKESSLIQLLPLPSPPRKKTHRAFRGTTRFKIFCVHHYALYTQTPFMTRTPFSFSGGFKVFLAFVRWLRCPQPVAKSRRGIPAPEARDRSE